jgi:photosystem II stability/assembly factor-like uncharacterized protein
MPDVRETGARLASLAPVRHRLRYTLAAGIAIFVCAGVASLAQTRRPARRPAAPAAARHAPLKAIFEPVPYPHDVDISDVFFVDPETGWVSGHHRTSAGDGGFIVATRDGGKTWAIQIGDGDSPAPAFTRLFFLDAARGWAVRADGALFRTTDGAGWAPIGTVPAHSPIVFVTPDRGFTLDGGEIRTTTDAGRTWSASHRCRATIDGPSAPPRECEPVAIAFAPDRATGYVVTRPIDGDAAAVIGTADGGVTWTVTSIVRGVRDAAMSLAFPDPVNGYLRAGGVLKGTSDGGVTWHTVSVAVPGGPSIVQAKGSVGWMVGSHDFSYTLDRGRRWIARRVDFPAEVVRFTVVDRDTGYVVGSHGMVYRYRVVPFDYAVPHMLTIPGMTTFVPDGS